MEMSIWKIQNVAGSKILINSGRSFLYFLEWKYEENELKRDENSEYEAWKMPKNFLKGITDINKNQLMTVNDRITTT